MHAGITALLEALASIDAQLAKLDSELKELARGSEIAWRLMSVPSIGPVTALAYIAAIKDPHRLKRTRDMGACLGPDRETPSSAETNIGMAL